MSPRLALVTAALALGGLGAWHAFSGADAAASDNVAPANPGRPRPQPLAMAAPAPMPAATARTAPPSPAAPQLAGVVDVCGLGRFSSPAGSAAGGLDALPAPIGQEPLTRARERMLATLRGGPPRARAAALLMAPPAADNDAARQAWGQALVREAMASQDPVVMAWAEEGCGQLPDGPACRLALVRDRLRLEPDNGHHWAALAEEDPGAADEAWRGLQQARRWQQSPQSLLLVTQAALPHDVPGYLRLALAAEATTRAATLPGPGDGFLSERCASTAEPTRQACGQIAQVLTAHSDSMALLTQGQHLGQAAGWPAERLRALQREIQSLNRQHGWTADADQPLACSSVEAWQQHLARLASQGELGALRAQLTPATGAGGPP